jgi:hypothetical protein
VVVYGFALLVFGYALAYAGMTGWLSLLSGGKIPKQSVLTALGVTGPNGLSTSLASYGLKVNPFANAAALGDSGDAIALVKNLGITSQMAPAAYLAGNGQKATAPATQSQVSGNQALGNGGAVAA